MSASSRLRRLFGWMWCGSWDFSTCLRSFPYPTCLPTDENSLHASTPSEGTTPSRMAA